MTLQRIQENNKFLFLSKGDDVMPFYKMTVTLEMTDYVRADSPEEAFQILSDDAMSGGSWDYSYEEVDEDGLPLYD